ncbi:MAG: hypothetical protein LUQ16_03530, partial [Methanomassiliicoccales archaeon]|nr:hypothetical protein [Methanomassiliicoccales archaeon]
MPQHSSVKRRMELETPERFRPVVDHELCRRCKKCVMECSFRALEFVDGTVKPIGGCVACGRCINVCPVHCIEVRQVQSMFPPHANFNERVRRGIMSQATTGGVLLTSCGTDIPYPVMFDEMLLDAAQVTNPAIDPLREIVETKTFVGGRKGSLDLKKNGRLSIGADPGPMVAMDMPIMIGHISLGSVSYNA